MKFTFSWLLDHLETDHSLAAICDVLPMLGLEVEDLHNPVAALAPFQIVEIIEANPHPDACLLYTSPSPRDQRGSRMPSSA